MDSYNHSMGQKTMDSYNHELDVLDVLDAHNHHVHEMVRLDDASLLLHMNVADQKYAVVDYPCDVVDDAEVEKGYPYDPAAEQDCPCDVLLCHEIQYLAVDELHPF